mmetsp:Transcript_24578/g.52935  ORF Transcript_24578/g.52935 Transcript_24578/m.52935 type:complete len:208 (-) Transcript_24578:65-688(-)
MSNPKCLVCTKTVYPMEAIRYKDNAYHKLCFKCQEPGCGLKLTLKTANNILDKVFCAKHTPKDKPTATTVDGNMALANAKNAPKVAVVSNEKRGDNMEKPAGFTVEGSLEMSRAKEAHKNAQALVSNEQRAAPGGDKNCQVADMATINAKNAPKVGTVNEQVRAGAGERNAQVADLSTTNAMNAPKNSTINEQVRPGAGERNAQNFI